MEADIRTSANAGQEAPPERRGGLVETRERVTAWECIGCGRVEGPQPCIGVCQDRKVEFVYAARYDDLLARFARSREHAAALAALVRRLAVTTPRAGQWERTYRALQAQARKLLAEDAVEA